MCSNVGFFIFFMSMPLVSNVERLFKAKVTSLIAPDYDGFNVSTYPKSFVPRVYWFSCWFMFTCLMNYMAQVFHFGSLERCIAGLGSYYYLGHIGSVLAYVVLLVMPSPYTKNNRAISSQKSD